MPIVAIAPLLIIWFGAGIASKVIICALLVFFPMLVNTVLGMRNIPPELRDLMRSLEATPLQTFWHLELPAALPILLGGLKVSATLSVIGAVVGEFVSASAGLGYLINFGRGIYDTPLVIAAVFTLTGLALLLYGLAAWLERILLDWQDWQQNQAAIPGKLASRFADLLTGEICPMQTRQSRNRLIAAWALVVADLLARAAGALRYRTRLQDDEQRNRATDQSHAVHELYPQRAVCADLRGRRARLFCRRGDRYRV